MILRKKLLFFKAFKELVIKSGDLFSGQDAKII